MGKSKKQTDENGAGGGRPRPFWEKKSVLERTACEIVSRGHLARIILFREILSAKVVSEKSWETHHSA